MGGSGPAEGNVQGWVQRVGWAQRGSEGTQGSSFPYSACASAGSSHCYEYCFSNELENNRNQMILRSATHIWPLTSQAVSLRLILRCFEGRVKWSTRAPCPCHQKSDFRSRKFSTVAEKRLENSQEFFFVDLIGYHQRMPPGRGVPFLPHHARKREALYKHRNQDAGGWRAS